jgi:hypothetical protein
MFLTLNGTDLRADMDEFWDFHTYYALALGQPRESHTFKGQSGKKADNTTRRSDAHSVGPKGLSQCHSSLPSIVTIVRNSRSLSSNRWLIAHPN